MLFRFEGFGLSGFYVIFVSVFVFVSRNFGFGMVLKMLFFGVNYVVEFDDFEVWVNKIKVVRVKDLIFCVLEVE